MGNSFSTLPVPSVFVKSAALRKYFTGAGKLRSVSALGKRSFLEETNSRRRCLTDYLGTSTGSVPEVKQGLDYLKGLSTGEKSQSLASCCTVIEPKGVKWHKPKKGFVKVNVNASVKIFKGTVGGVIRDWEGLFKLGFTERLVEEIKSCAFAEYLAAVSGMEVAVKEGHKNICLESDNEGLVFQINSWMLKSENQIELLMASGCNSDKQDRQVCLLKIIQLIGQCECVEVSHTYKEGNRLADHFARRDTTTAEGRVIIRELVDGEGKEKWEHDFKGLELPKGSLRKSAKEVKPKTN